MDIVLIAFVVLIAFGMRKQDKSALPSEKLSKETMLPLRGIVCFCIIFHHFSQITNGNYDIAFHYFCYTGYLLVSIFFAISGYALSLQYKNKKSSYLNHFLKKRFKELLIPFFIVALLFTALYIVFDLYLKENVLKDISFRLYDTLARGNTFVPYSWYVETALFLYILFYVAKKICHNRKKDYSNVIILFGVIIYMVLCRCIGYGEWWYNSVISFPLGIFYFKFTESSVYKKINPLLIASISLLLFAVSCTPQITSVFTGKLSVIDSLFRSFLFPLITFSILQVIKIKSKFFEYIGKRSYEIYLVQGVPIKFLQPFILKVIPYGFLSELIFLISSLVCCVVLGEIVYRLSNKIKNHTFTLHN